LSKRLRSNQSSYATQACSTFEKILIADQSTLKKATVAEALQTAAGTYEELQTVELQVDDLAHSARWPNLLEEAAPGQ
jgi:hypothetical protein